MIKDMITMDTSRDQSILSSTSLNSRDSMTSSATSSTFTSRISSVTSNNNSINVISLAKNKAMPFNVMDKRRPKIRSLSHLLSISNTFGERVHPTLRCHRRFVTNTLEAYWTTSETRLTFHTSFPTWGALLLRRLRIIWLSSSTQCFPVGMRWILTYLQTICLNLVAQFWT